MHSSRSNLRSCWVPLRSPFPFFSPAPASAIATWILHPRRRLRDTLPPGLGWCLGCGTQARCHSSPSPDSLLLQGFTSQPGPVSGSVASTHKLLELSSFDSRAQLVILHFDAQVTRAALICQPGPVSRFAPLTQTLLELSLLEAGPS